MSLTGRLCWCAALQDAASCSQPPVSFTAHFCTAGGSNCLQQPVYCVRPGPCSVRGAGRLLPFIVLVQVHHPLGHFNPNLLSERAAGFVPLSTVCRILVTLSPTSSDVIDRVPHLVRPAPILVCEVLSPSLYCLWTVCGCLLGMKAFQVYRVHPYGNRLHASCCGFARASCWCVTSM